MKTFNIIRSQKISISLFLLILLVLLAWSVSVWVFHPMFDFRIKSGFEIFVILLPLMMIVPLVPLTIWISMIAYTTFKTRLIFDEQAIHLVGPKILPGILSGMLKPFTIYYRQIKSVQAKQLPGLLEILEMNGKGHRIAVSFFAKNFGEEILVELKNRLPDERFQLGVEIHVLHHTWAKSKRISTAIFVLYFLLYFSTLALEPFLPIRDRLVQAWTVEMRPSEYQKVRAYSIDNNQGFWVVSYHNFGDYLIYHYTDKVEQQWELPDPDNSKYPQQVSGDENGNPIVWLDDGILHFTEKNWHFIPYALDPEIQVDNYWLIVSGTQGWVIDRPNNETLLFNLNALTGAKSTIIPPESAVQAELSPSLIRRAANGNLLVLMDKESEARIYLLTQENEWRSNEYAVMINKSYRVEDLFLDGENSLWVLLNGPSLGEWLVEKITSSGEMKITRLPSPAPTDEWERYESIFADTHGRLWATGSYPGFITTFTPQWMSDAVEIERYTENNSNYVYGISYEPALDANGKTWAFGEKISTLDTNSFELPQPLPDWLANLNINFIRIGQSLFLLLPLFVQLWMVNGTVSDSKKALAR